MKILASKLLELGKAKGIKTLIQDNILDESLALTDRGVRVLDALTLVDNFDAVVTLAEEHIAAKKAA